MEFEHFFVQTYDCDINDRCTYLILILTKRFRDKIIYFNLNRKDCINLR